MRNSSEAHDGHWHGCLSGVKSDKDKDHPTRLSQRVVEDSPRRLQKVNSSIIFKDTIMRHHMRNQRIEESSSLRHRTVANAALARVSAALFLPAQREDLCDVSKANHSIQSSSHLSCICSHSTHQFTFRLNTLESRPRHFRSFSPLFSEMAPETRSLSRAFFDQ
jgi:hypothetical protein